MRDITSILHVHSFCLYSAYLLSLIESSIHIFRVPGAMQSITSDIRATFRTDGSIKRQGFEMMYTIVHDPEVPVPPAPVRPMTGLQNPKLTINLHTKMSTV